MLSLPWMFYLKVHLFLLTDSLSAPLSSPGFLVQALTPEQVQKYVSSSVQPNEVERKFWAAVAAVCSPSFHLSISFSAPVLSPVSPGPRWRYSDWYTVDSRQQIPDSVSAILSCSSCVFTPSPKGFAIFITVFFFPPKNWSRQSIRLHLCWFFSSNFPHFWRQRWALWPMSQEKQNNKEHFRRSSSLRFPHEGSGTVTKAGLVLDRDWFWTGTGPGQGLGCPHCWLENMAAPMLWWL